MASIGVKINPSPYDNAAGTGLAKMLAGFLTDPDQEATLARLRLQEQAVQSNAAVDRSTIEQNAIENRRLEADRERLLSDRQRIDAERTKTSAEQAQIEQQNAAAAGAGTAAGNLFDSSMPAIVKTDLTSNYQANPATSVPLMPVEVPRDQQEIDAEIARRKAERDLYINGATSIFSKGGGTADDLNKVLAGIQYQGAETDRKRREALGLGGVGTLPSVTTDLTGEGAQQAQQDTLAKAEAALRGQHEGLQSRKNYFVARNAYETMVASAADDTGASDLPFTYGIAQIMDPASVVRDSETGAVRIAATGSVTQSLAAELNSYLNGTGKLTAAARYRLLRMARPKVQAMEGQYLADRTPMENTIKAFGYDPLRVLAPFKPMTESDWEKHMAEQTAAEAAAAAAQQRQDELMAE